MKRNIDYTARNLKAFALNYDIKPVPYILHGIAVIDPWPIAEFRADFDSALASLKRQHKRLVIADIEGYPTQTKDAVKLKSQAYKLMAKFLNR